MQKTHYFPCSKGMPALFKTWKFLLCELFAEWLCWKTKRHLELISVMTQLDTVSINMLPEAAICVTRVSITFYPSAFTIWMILYELSFVVHLKLWLRPKEFCFYFSKLQKLLYWLMGCLQYLQLWLLWMIGGVKRANQKPFVYIWLSAAAANPTASFHQQSDCF